jgi:short-subunit dehydrogenase involved in D-alanine esterification of teichoic acids
MKTTDNTILITGGGSGIGRGLAEAFHRLGNKVIIAGRGQKALDETTAANPRAMPLDEYIDEAMSILKTQPDVKEVCVKKVYPLRFSAEHGQQKYEEFFQQFNDSFVNDF